MNSQKNANAFFGYTPNGQYCTVALGASDMLVFELKVHHKSLTRQPVQCMGKGRINKKNLLHSYQKVLKSN